MQERLFVLSTEQIVDLILKGKPISEENVCITSKSSLLSVIMLLHEKMECLKNGKNHKI